MFCEKCGKEIKDGDKFCPYCGAENEINKEETGKWSEILPKLWKPGRNTGKSD